MKIGIVTQYPQPNQEHDMRLSGVATFSKYLYSDVAVGDDDIYIYANTQDKVFEDTSGEAHVLYLWKKGMNPFPAILKDAKKRGIDIIHVHHELFLYGKLPANFFFAVFLMRCKMAGIRVVVEYHAVVPLKKVNGAFTAENGIKAPPFLVRICFRGLYFVVDRFTHAYVVHEKLFEEYMVDYYHIRREKVHIVGLPCIRPTVTYENGEAKRKLGFDPSSQLILFLGFITGYKGLDILCEASNSFMPQLPNANLFIAGGMHPRLEHDPEYLAGVEKTKSQMYPLRSVWHGYASDEEMPVLFSAADLVVFPYTVGMSSSGPLAQAIAYGAPMIVSDAFKDIVLCDCCFFGTTPEQLSTKIISFFSDPEQRECIQKYAKNLRDERDPEVLWSRLTAIYSELQGLSSKSVKEESDTICTTSAE